MRLHSIRCWSAALMVSLFAGCSGAQAQSRVALVIGIGAYQHAPKLPTTAKDAAAVAQAFDRLDFTTIRVIDATYDETRKAIRNFNELSRAAEFAVVYFAGYGVELGGANWLLPADAELRTELDVPSETIGLNALIQSVGRATGLGLIILDASRNNPDLAGIKGTGRAVSRGLARIEPGQNVVVAYAAKDGTVAAGGGLAGLYTAALLRFIETPGLDISLMFRKVRDDVVAQSGGRQLPFVYGSLPSKPIYFKEAAASAPGPFPKPNPALEAETIWQSIRDSSDLRLMSEFVARFPESAHVAEARVKLSALAPPPPAPVPAVPQLTDVDAVDACDRLAASPLDSLRSNQVTGVELSRIDVSLAKPACAEAMSRHPDVARFPFQAARVALARHDNAAAREFYEKASALGSALAMYSLGVIYAEGKIVDQDYAAARRWFEKAVAHDSAFAMADLAALYENGRGGARDLAKALDLYRKAAAAGDRTSMTRIGNFYETGQVVRRDYGQALRWYQKSADLGDDTAMRQLGKLFEDGRGVPKSAAEARKWFERADRHAAGQ